MNKDENKKMYEIDYNAVKAAIRKSYTAAKFNVTFKIDYECLMTELSKLGLTPIPITSNSTAITTDNMFGLAEFYKGAKISALTDQREFIYLLFVKSDSYDDYCQRIVEHITSDNDSVGNFDKIEAISYIISNYPCYTAACISYKAVSANKSNFVGLDIICKANAVTLKNNSSKVVTEEVNNQ